MLKILGVNHIGMAAKDAQQARWFFAEVLGLPFLGDELVKEQKTLTSMFGASGLAEVKTPRLEILQQAEGEDQGPIKAYLEKKGGGIHHIALTVEDIEAALDHLKAHQVKLIDSTPRPGAHKTRIAFVHPHATGGFLVELVQEMNA